MITRVLNCITGLNVGGAEYMLARFVNELRGTDYLPEVMSLMSPGPVAALLRANNVPIHALDMHTSMTSLRALTRLRSVMAATPSDLLHGWMYHGNLAASAAALMGASQPVIWSVHHSLDEIKREKPLTRFIIRLQARLSKMTSAISYCSSTAAAQHEALGFDASKRVIIPNGIDCEAFRPLPNARERIRAELNIPPERLVIGNVARAHPMKNHEGFVRILAQLRTQGFDVHGLIIGEGHSDGAARRLARDMDLEDRLTTPGPRSDVASLLPGFDVFVLSSAWGEAFPLSVAEAMACGVPVVATDIGDCAWLIGDHDLISRPGDPEAQAQVVASLFSQSAEARSKRGLAGRKRVEQRFSLRQYRDAHMCLYEAALEERRRSGSNNAWRRIGA
ncbi:glycosyltransferase [Rhizobium sullae]|uniref:glycosyltransferase n=1 Tax=Rhizobium sullae TaxID=50338 RepID=UPI000B36286D|nr:glycosyltransferase [Rhizobium sullae]